MGLGIYGVKLGLRHCCGNAQQSPFSQRNIHLTRSYKLAKGVFKRTNSQKTGGKKFFVFVRNGLWIKIE